MSPMFDPLGGDDGDEPPGCEAFEIAISMRARDALPPRAVPVLDRHLPGCASCRQFAEQLARVEAALATHAAAQATGGRDWQLIHDKLSASVARYRRVMPLAMVGGTVGGHGLYWVLHALFVGEPLRWWSLAVIEAPIAVLLAGTYFWTLRRSRRLLAQSDVVATYRGELERGIRAQRLLRWYFPAVVIWMLHRGLSVFSQAMAGDGKAQLRLVFNVVLAVFVLACFLVSLPAWRRARRELAELR